MTTAPFHRFTLELPDAFVEACRQPTPGNDKVADWARMIPRPSTVTRELLRAELRGYGGWGDDELADDAANWERILWLAAGNIQASK